MEINPIKDDGKVDYDKIINEPTSHVAQNTINKNDKLNWTDDETELLRYIKIRNKGNVDVYYSPLSPGVEKPIDNDNFSYEYCGRGKALLMMYAAQYGEAEALKLLDDYLDKLKAEKHNKFYKNLELEVLRKEKQIEDKLLGKGLKLHV